MPTLAVVSKGPRSFQLRGPFALPRLRHRHLLLVNKGSRESMVDRLLARFKASTLDSLVNRGPYWLRNPYVHFPITPFTADLSETLNSVGSFSSRHGVHPLHSWPFREMPDSELAVESGVKNPFTIDRFSGGKLLCEESFSPKRRVNSHVEGRFRVIRSYPLDSLLHSIHLKTRSALRSYDSRIVG